MNVNEYGLIFAFLTSYDMSGNTSLSITFTKPNGTTLIVTSPDVTAPNTPLQTGGPVFPANLYAQYFFKEGDVDQVGVWSARVEYQNANAMPPIQLISDPGTFNVNP